MKHGDVMAAGITDLPAVGMVVPVVSADIVREEGATGAGGGVGSAAAAGAVAAEGVPRRGE